MLTLFSIQLQICNILNKLFASTYCRGGRWHWYYWPSRCNWCHRADGNDWRHWTDWSSWNARFAASFSHYNFFQ